MKDVHWTSMQPLIIDRSIDVKNIYSVFLNQKDMPQDSYIVYDTICNNKKKKFLTCKNMGSHMCRKKTGRLYITKVVMSSLKGEED